MTICRIGKVAAATTATILIEKFQVDRIIFTGMAGAVSPELNRGDIVLCDQAYQHDLDVRPLCLEPFQEPLSGRQLLTIDSEDVLLSKNAIEQFIKKLDQYVDRSELKRLDIEMPKLHTGIIATGDHFIQDINAYPNLHIQSMPALAVEMEGASIGQVCAEFGVPFILIRTISDKANSDAHVSLKDFSVHVASRYSSGIVKELLELL